MGFTFSPKPDDEVPSLPSDLGDLSEDLMMELFFQLTQWANYAAVQVTKAETEEDEAASRLKMAEAFYEIRNFEEGDKVTVIRKEGLLDPEIVDLRDHLARKKALRKMLSTMLGNIERSSAAVSRELTRRVGLSGPAGRAGRVRP